MNFLRQLKFLTPILIGCIVFYVIGGYIVLDPSRVGWLFSDDDPVQHYLGWSFFQKSPWGIPIGVNPNYGLDISSSIIYSDSIPLLAILFKIFSNYLPNTFQYFGIWMLLCFILQSWFAWILLGIVSKDWIIRISAITLFLFSPIMLNRIGAHAALSGHFLILAAIYLYFSKNQKNRIFLWTSLISIAALVHFYLLVMVLCIWITSLIDLKLNKTVFSFYAVFKEIFFITTLLLFIMWLSGYFIIGLGFASGSWGYGTWAMNIFSIFNGKGWSYLLSPIPGVTAHQDRYQYPGIGSLILMAIALGAIIRDLFNTRKLSINIFSCYPALILMVLFLFFFAVSNFINIGPIHFQFKLPNFLLVVGNSLRASDRLFWPVIYLLIVISAFIVIKNYSKSLTRMILVVCCIFQIIDTSDGWIKLHQNLESQPFEAPHSILINKFWNGAPTQYKKLVLVPYKNAPENWQIFSPYAVNNNLATNAAYLARVDEGNLQRAREALNIGTINPDTFYVITEPQLRFMLANLDFTKDLLAKIDGFNVLAPGWKACKKCQQVDEKLELKIFAPQTILNELIYFGFKSAASKSYLLTGWSSIVEDWGVWSNGKLSQLFLPLPEGMKKQQLELITRAFIANNIHQQEVEIWANGIFQKKVFLDRAEENHIIVQIPEKAIMQNYLVLTFRYINPKRPKDIGMGDDDRLLGIGLVSAIFY